jgi:gamma-glutamyltranspeptidase/glutathione hydrolase
MRDVHYTTDRFNGRRSAVMARRALAATAQPLASMAAIRILLAGGNAVDAAVAAAAVLGVTEPYQTGLGGDCFALIYEPRTGNVRALNGSGPAPAAARLADYRAAGHVQVPMQSPLAWTVPGCVDGWCRMLDECGTMSLADVLAPAIDCAEGGFPVAPGDAAVWRDNAAALQADPGARANLLIDGRAPRPGEVLVQKTLARTLRLLAEGGRDAFYDGPIAERRVAFSERSGGLLSRDDLRAYRAEWQMPIGVDYRGRRILQCPPNGQGFAALLALRCVEDVDFAGLDRGGADCLHQLIEATKHGMTRSAALVADPRFAPFDVAAALAAQGRSAPLPYAASSPPSPRPAPADTVYAAVVDADGNAVSFINSVYGDFGSGHNVGDLGFMMQNRGACFSLNAASPNCLAPGKRPFHTIIPAMALEGGAPSLVFGVVGGFIQPQGHLQVLVNLLDYGMDVQTAIDTPRFYWEEGRRVVVEDGFPAATYAGLQAWGHEVARRQGHRGFGGAQVIAVDRDAGVLIGGSEPRQDGCAIGY